MAGLKRTGQLADDFFLVVHDDVSTRPRLSDRILGLGLACALLGELSLLGAIDVEGGRVVLGDGAPPPDTLAADVFGDVAGERPLPVRDWLDYLGLRAVERVAGRLEAAGLVVRRQSRVRLPGSPGRWVPTDPARATWPAIDVKLKVFNGQADTHHLMLFGLARATGLNHPSFLEVRGLLQDPALLGATLAPLGLNPALPELLAHTEAAVGSAVTSRTG